MTTSHKLNKLACVYSRHAPAASKLQFLPSDDLPCKGAALTQGDYGGGMHRAWLRTPCTSVLIPTPLVLPRMSHCMSVILVLRHAPGHQYVLNG
jgi:hypothetical protein